MSDDLGRVLHGTTGRPLEGVRIVYPKGDHGEEPKALTKGEAWAHLMRNPPTVVVNGAYYTPLFEPMRNFRGEEHLSNPYRKDHDEQNWAWTVTRWRPCPAVRKSKPPKPPKPEPKTRYELLMDDGWVGVQDPE